jgi:hypothetical protein
MQQPRADRRAQVRAFVAATISLLVGVSLLLLLAQRLDDHQLFYAVDDSFIHLTFARTLAESGTYGLFPGIYESATSSPAWSLILAACVYALPRLATWWPLILNVCLSIAVLALLLEDQNLLLPKAGDYLSWAAVLLLPYALFLPGLIFIGMEHTLQALVLLIALLCLEPVARGNISSRRLVPLFATLALAPLVRMEFLALAAGCAIAILFAGPSAAHSYRKRLLIGGTGVICALVPLSLVGLDNLRHGQAFLGNSATTKLLEDGHNSGLTGALKHILTGGNLLENAAENPTVFVFTTLLVLTTLLCLFSGREKYRASAMAMSVVAVAQYCFGQFGHFHRYESYLLTGCAFVLLRVFGDQDARATMPRYALPMVLFLLIFVPVEQYQAIASIPDACNDHYLQQHQMARFFARFYGGETVAVNDLGSVSYEHNGPVLDLVGLGSHNVANRILQEKHALEPIDMATLVSQSDVKAIAIYQNWFRHGVPDSWVKVGELRMLRRPVEVAGDTVSFFAPNRELAIPLSKRLQEFSPTLPPNSRITLAQNSPP